ncbi:MAG: hypothetical protein M1828_002066 [Chrysothrix sp. TS-e1954]|nr:MAG: hypothetical protein M1828_002066 [Chrysothrix sp. TS-e1954]
MKATPDDMDKITDKLAKLPDGANYFSLEFFPPKTAEGFSNILPRLTRLAQYRPLFVTVTWGAGGSTATKSFDLAEICQRQLKLTTCLHMTCTNTTKRTLDHALQKAKRLGIRNILALRGDEPRGTEYDDSIDEDFERVKVTSVDGDVGEPTFAYAVDLVRYIRKQYGEWFCIGVAGYPDGHAVSPYSPDRSVKKDVGFLVEKVQAGADFIMTQLFYDVDKFLAYEKMLREHESGLFKSMPIMPGLMPIQSWNMLTRTTALSCASVPKCILQSLEEVKKDDETVRDRGVDIMRDIVCRIKQEALTKTVEEPNGIAIHTPDENPRKRKRAPQGFHFYTLNLERAAAQIVEECDLIPSEEITPLDEQDRSPVVITEQSSPFPVNEPEKATLLPGGFHHPFAMSDTKVGGPKVPLSIEKRRLSSQNLDPQNKLVVSRSPASPNRRFEQLEREAGTPRRASIRNSIAVSDGSVPPSATLGLETPKDDYPNGRFGDARSPAFGSFDNWGPTMRVSPSTVKSMWGEPTNAKDITTLFHRYLKGELSGIPWSEEALSDETAMIRDQMLAMNERGWWTISSQPAVDSVRSDDEVLGWGPRVGGWVWQKPFVEFFLPSEDWTKLKAKLDKLEDQVSYYAGDSKGEFQTNNAEDQTNPVTWGAFTGKEILTPTIIDGVSFRSWQDEAFGIWREWRRCHTSTSPQAQFLDRMRKDVWLVNVIGHEFKDGGNLWDLLKLDD